MIDGQEPKNGDFASYVENLTRAPSGHAPGAEPPGSRAPQPRSKAAHSPGAGPPGAETPAQQARAEVARALAALRAKKGRQDAPAAPGSLWGRSAGTAAGGTGLQGALDDAMQTGDTTRVAQQLRTFVSRVLGRIAMLAFFAGVVIVGLSIADDSLEIASPGAGVVLMIVGAVLHRAAAKLG